MRLTRRVARIEHAVRNIPDPREAARLDAEQWRWKLTFDLAFSDEEARELELAIAERAATEMSGDPEFSNCEAEKYRCVPTAEIHARFSARMEEIMKQRGLKDIEEWVPTSYGMPEEYEARRRAARAGAGQQRRATFPA